MSDWFDTLNKADLLKLAGYLHLEYPKNVKKGELIDILKKYFEPPEEELPQMSARVRRIYELNKEK